MEEPALRAELLPALPGYTALFYGRAPTAADPVAGPVEGAALLTRNSRLEVLHHETVRRCPRPGLDRLSSVSPHLGAITATSWSIFQDASAGTSQAVAPLFEELSFPRCVLMHGASWSLPFKRNWVVVTINHMEQHSNYRSCPPLSRLADHLDADVAAAAAGSRCAKVLTAREDGAVMALVRDTVTGRRFGVICTHLFWDPAWPDVKLLQVPLRCCSGQRDFSDSWSAGFGPSSR